MHATLFCWCTGDYFDYYSYLYFDDLFVDPSSEATRSASAYLLDASPPSSLVQWCLKYLIKFVHYKVLYLQALCAKQGLQ